MNVKESLIEECINQSTSRMDLWITFLNAAGVETFAEIGVYRGDFAAEILRNANCINRYYMIDPWRNLEDWNKPANKGNDTFNEYYETTLDKTDFASAKRIVLRGKTTEVVDEIPDGYLDFAYIDGDHTLKGIAIDLIRLYPKIKDDGWIAGDDFCASIWQHTTNFEPTLVFPFAIYFAEAMSTKIFALPYNQFLIKKTENSTYKFVDFTSEYGELGLRKQLIQRWAAKDFKEIIKKMFPFLVRLKSGFR